jgi:predicted alpha-1,2-mannosidase
MTGYHAIPVIAEAYRKGIKGFDAEKAYAAMKATMMQDKRGLDLYKKYGYVPYDLLDESVTITLEFAYDDWCVAQMAKALGKTEDYEYFSKRSRAYTYLFDKNTGFMRGKAQDGKTWHEPFDPKFSSHRVHADYTEGNAWQHSWFVLHDVEDLINMHGGKEAFNSKLEQLFTESSEITGDNVSADISGLIGQYAHGNEPSHHIAYMFNYSGQPWRTQYWVREILKTQYKTGPEGLSGNEDCGQMSAWFVMSAMGIYPYNPASGIYQIGSPIFKRSSIKISEDKTFDIVAHDTSDKNIYIQSARLNGKDINRTTLTHEEIIQGGLLEISMGPEPNKNWGILN